MGQRKVKNEKPILFSSSVRWVKVAARRIGVTPEDYARELNSGRKYCGGCGASYLRVTENWGFDSKTFDKLKSRCRSCVSESKKSHYHRTRPAQRERQLRYQRENRERLYAYNARWQRERNAKLRMEMLQAYGAACACCGESEVKFLDLDHVRNDGAQHRREMKNQTQILLWLRDRGWPKDGYQVLCCNCNQGKARNGGICPHQTKNQ